MGVLLLIPILILGTLLIATISALIPALIKNNFPINKILIVFLGIGLFAFYYFAGGMSYYPFWVSMIFTIIHSVISLVLVLIPNEKIQLAGIITSIGSILLAILSTYQVFRDFSSVMG